MVIKAMRLGISTASFFSRTATEDSLDYIGKNGVKLAEVFLDTWSEYSLEFAEILNCRAEKHGVSISAVHAMSMQFEPQLFSIGVRQRKDAWTTFERVLKAAKKLSAGIYVMHGPATLAGTLRNAQIDRMAPIANDLAELAKQYGVKLCWENVSWAIFSQPEFALRLRERNISDNLGFTLDIKQAIRSGCEPAEFAKAMGDRLWHVHLCDCTMTEDGKVLSYDLPFRGGFDFVGFADVLRESGYDNDMMIEVYSDLYDSMHDVIECRNRTADALGLE